MVGIIMSVQCDTCEMKAKGYTLSISLENPTGFTCKECIDWRPHCDSCKSKEISITEGFGHCIKSCYACGYNIESTFIGVMPKRLIGVISEEAMAILDADENCEIRIWVEKV